MKKLKYQGGSNLVEFALVLPLLLILVFGIIDFGLLLFDKAVITNAAREGARFGIVYDEPRPSVAQIEARVLQYCSTHLVSFGGTGPTVTVVPGADSGDPLTVSVAYTYVPVGIAKMIPSLSNFNVGASSVMRLE